MSGNNLSVKITADVVDLQTKFGIAKAEAAGLSAELNKLNRAAAAGNLTILPGAMQQLVGDFAAAKTQANSLGVALGQASGGVLGITSSLEQGHGSISTATREFRALFDELSSGRTRQTPGTLAIIAQRVIGLGPAALGAVAGVGLLTGALGYLLYRSIEASKALDQAFLGAQFAGNLEISRDAIKQFADEMSHAKNISSSDAREIATSLASIPGITLPIFHALSAEISDFAQLTGQAGPKAAEELAKAFNQKTSAADFARSLGGVTQAQINMAEAADRSGDSVKEQEAKFSVLLTTIGRSTSTLDQQNQKVTASIGNWLGYGGALASGTSLEEINADVVAQSNKARQQQLDILKEVAGQLKNTQQSPDQTLKTGVSAAEKENPVTQQVTEAKSKIDEMNAALAVAISRGEQIGDTNFDKLNAGLQKAQENLSNLQFGPVLERMREQMQQVASTWDGTQTGLLAKQIQIGQETLANVKGNSKETVAVQTEIARLEVQEHQAASRQVIEDARQRVADIGSIENQSAVSRAAQDHAIWQSALADSRLNAQGRIEVERDVAQAATQIHRAAAQEQATIDRQNVQTDIAISHLQIEAQKSALQLGTAASADAVAARLAQLRQLTATEFALNQDALQNELSQLEQSPAEYNRVFNEIREQKARLVIDLQNLDKEAADANKKYTKEQGAEWHSVVGEIENAESGLVGDILNRRRSLAQSLAQIGAQIVTSEISNDLKAMTTKILLSNQEKALEQGGLLYHLLFQKQKTAATVAAQQAQTGAVTAGQTAQNTALISGAASGKAVQAATGPSQVMADAAEAFAGAYAATAAIPYIGPELAPAAAAEAFAAVASMAGAASLDVGTNYVPRDMYARIHEGEAVVPKEFNPAAGGGSSGGGGGGYQEQHNYNGNINLRALDTRGIRSLLKGQRNRREVAQAARQFINRGGGRR
jgi:hypothetical protein